MKALSRQEYIASCEKRGREIDGVSDNAVSPFVGDYESAEAAKADFQKLEHLHHKGTSAVFALSSYGSPVPSACAKQTRSLPHCPNHGEQNKHQRRSPGLRHQPQGQGAGGR
jgi:hypothetical protein